MRLLRSGKIRHAIAFGLGAAIGVLYFMSSLNAYADSGISIAGNGQVIVRGAKVVQVSGNEITAQTQWGGAKMIWKVVVSGSTRFTPARDHEELANDVHVHEFIAFSGLINQRVAAPTVLAMMVRNESVVQSATIIDGSVVGYDDSGLIVDTENGTSTIRIGTGTIMTRDGNQAHVNDLALGETVKAFGTFNLRSRTLDAQRVISISFPDIPNTGAQVKQGVFASIVAWFRQSGSLFSVK